MTQPVKTLNIKEYIKEYEARHPPIRTEVPIDPSTRWFKKDPMTECVDACRYELFTTARKEGGLQERYALLQSDCIPACKARIEKQ
jgi:hypothetical protein